MMRNRARVLIIALVFIHLSGCSSIPTSKPLAPTVEIAGLDVVKLGFRRQELEFTLDVFNPNNYDLPVNNLSFIASSDNQAIAEGSSDIPVLLTANGTTEVVINVTARANRLLRKLIASSINEKSMLAYNVTGFVKLDNWPARIPFNVDKTLSLGGS
ncbi:MAG: LEA type 2 family protein [Granulosicoccus sp.]